LPGFRTKIDVPFSWESDFWNRMPVRALIVVFLLTLACVSDNYVDSYDGQRRVSAAYAAKAKQCNQPISLLIVVPFDEQESDIKNCENALLSAACPITAIPGACFLLLIKKSPHGALSH